MVSVSFFTSSSDFGGMDGAAIDGTKTISVMYLKESNNFGQSLHVIVWVSKITLLLYPQRFRVRFWCQFRNWNPFSLKVNIGLDFFVCGMAYFIKEIYRKYTGKSRKYPIIVSMMGSFR